jgi:putative FmdB family regulatory protein
MPIYDIMCQECGRKHEVLVVSAEDALKCPNCGSRHISKLMSAPSTLTGRTPQALPGPKDTACCGSTPDRAGCAGPGSCCGKTT